MISSFLFEVACAGVLVSRFDGCRVSCIVTFVLSLLAYFSFSFGRVFHVHSIATVLPNRYDLAIAV